MLAIAAHPDDIEFMMAGTLILLADEGWEVHCVNVSSGNLGSLTLSPAETAQVRQSFSHGRSKTVTVEVRKKRAISPGLPEAGRAEASPAVAREQTAPRPAAAEPAPRRPVVLARGKRGLSLAI